LAGVNGKSENGGGEKKFSTGKTSLKCRGFKPTKKRLGSVGGGDRVGPADADGAQTRRKASVKRQRIGGVQGTSFGQEQKAALQAGHNSNTNPASEKVDNFI